MAKLHELLAVESNLETQANKVRSELAATFEKKAHLFMEKRTMFTSNAEGSSPVLETQSDLQTTVTKELEWVTGHLGKYWNASYQIAETNTYARANVVLEDSGEVLAENVPAIALLELQKRLSELLDLAKAIPTLDPAKGFTLDSDRGTGIYKAREITKKRTGKIPRVITKAEAMIKDGVGLPAQVELIYLDEPVGTIQEQEWSSMITPADKAALLDRIEKVIRAVRSARARANECSVQKQEIANPLFRYIFGS